MKFYYLRGLKAPIACLSPDEDFVLTKWEKDRLLAQPITIPAGITLEAAMALYPPPQEPAKIPSSPRPEDLQPT